MDSTPMTATARDLDPTLPDELMKICAWCQTVIRPGCQPATHVICPTCQAKVERTLDQRPSTEGSAR